MRLALSLGFSLFLAGTTVARAGDPAFFNGKDLENFQGLAPYWSVQEGAIVGSAPDGLKFNTFLCSKRTYGDFELKFQVRLKEGKGNSGVQIRSKIADEKKLSVAGPQCDMGAQYWGSLYGELFGGMMKASDPKIVEPVLKRDGFNDYHIKAVGKHITIQINGTTTVDGDFEKAPDVGIIAFQLHAGGPMEVTFRNIQFTEIQRKEAK